jgi:hypothetical protein
MCALERVMEVDAITCTTIVDENKLSDDEHNKSQECLQGPKVNSGRGSDKAYGQCQGRGQRRVFREPPYKQAYRFSISFVKRRKYTRGKLGKAGGAEKARKAGGAGEGCGEPVSAIDVLLSDGPVRSVLEVHSQSLKAG